MMQCTIQAKLFGLPQHTHVNIVDTDMNVSPYNMGPIGDSCDQPSGEKEGKGGKKKGRI